jgi:Tfp pilus assembly protein PilF
LQGALEDSATFFLAHKLNQLASHFRQLGTMTEAVNTNRTILSMRPVDKITRNNYGALLLSQQEFSKALEQFNLVYEQDPINPIISENIGALLLRLGDPAQATHFFEKALAFGAAATGKIYAQLGEAYAKTGRFSPALSALQLAHILLAQQATQNPENDSLQEQITLLQEWIHYIEGQLQSGNPAK